jgi:vesicle-associated membrane protein-associated protein A
LQTSSASNPLDDQVSEHREPAPEPELAPLPIPPVSSRRPSGQPVPDSLQQEDIESHPLFQELLSEYNAALAELQKLRRELDESSRYEGSKSRPYASSPASDIDDHVYQQDGVPLQIVVIIALAVFITTYLFL